MPSATIVKAWRQNGKAFLAVRVNEGVNGPTEYIGAVDLADLDKLNPGQIKAALIAAVKAVRDAQIGNETPIAGISGSVTI